MPDVDDKAAWEAWFNTQYDLWQDEIKGAIERACAGRSRTFRAAVIASLIESLSEELRSYLVLPASDAEPATVEAE